MKPRNLAAWAWLGLVACVGCNHPSMVPVLPPGVKQMRVAPPTAGSGAEAIGETAGVGGAPSSMVSTILSEPTPLNEDKKLASGLVYKTLKEGTGPSVKGGQTVKVNYVGRLQDGTEFDASAKHGGPAEFPIGVGRLIKAWDEGIPGMKIGEKRMLVAPGHLGYGAAGQPPTIPPNATLVFEVEMLEAR
jgi:FKBP-type peptidyl-prolyl cis-trans isomerase